MIQLEFTRRTDYIYNLYRHIVYIPTYVYIHSYMYTYIHACTHTCMYMCVYMHTYTVIYVDVYGIKSGNGRMQNGCLHTGNSEGLFEGQKSTAHCSSCKSVSES